LFPTLKGFPSILRSSGSKDTLKGIGGEVRRLTMEKKDLGRIKIRRALLSVSDKTNLIKLARTLSQLGVEIISTGGTRAELKKAGIKSISISSFTGFPEILGGRVKTLHPKVFGGILAIREDEEQKKEVTEQDINYIDLVVVNLYPFGKVISRDDVKKEDAIENVDIGGPSMLRAAAKNHESVAVVVNPERYGKIIQELESSGTPLITTA
jgi:phosphoribosylaminoimidazolecarboxamide formyltransferase/IMP cyclohydrolase